MPDMAAFMIYCMNFPSKIKLDIPSSLPPVSSKVSHMLRSAGTLAHRLLHDRKGIKILCADGDTFASRYLLLSSSPETGVKMLHLSFRIRTK